MDTKSFYHRKLQRVPRPFGNFTVFPRGDLVARLNIRRLMCWIRWFDAFEGFFSFGIWLIWNQIAKTLFRNVEKIIFLEMLYNLWGYVSDIEMIEDHNVHWSLVWSAGKILCRYPNWQCATWREKLELASSRETWSQVFVRLCELKGKTSQMIKSSLFKASLLVLGAKNKII